MDYTLLALGYLFTFLVPGFYFLETFFPFLPVRIKIPLVPLLSILISTYLVYFVSLILGFSRFSILISFSFFLPWLIFNFRKIISGLQKFMRSQPEGVFLFAVVFFIYLIALYPGIFTKHNGYIVMSSSNWQDTAMHLGIIESISQGNFPPQAPYFAGVPLNYYYFTDFHTSILETLYGRFFPRLLVYDNPLFAAIFVLLVYGLVYELTRDKTASLFSAFLSVFIGNYMFTEFFRDLGKGGKALNLLANNSYAIEFGGLFQISPMADYFLQNRPMMVGLPAFVAVVFLSIYLFRRQNPYLALLIGFVAGALIKFQFFAGLVSGGAFLVIAWANLFRGKGKIFLRALFYFAAVYLVFVLLFTGSARINGKPLLSVTLENLTSGPWEAGKNLSWYFEFVAKNLGLPFFITLFSLFLKKAKRMGALVFIALGLTLAPFMVRFTIMKYDMLKFAYFAEIIYSVVAFWCLRKIFKNNYLFAVFSVLVIITSSFTSFLNLINRFLNKTLAYTQAEVEAGFWIREQTPKNSVFIDLANLHSPVTEVAGRRRVLSYINWPHSHGYNTGPDNVFSRLEDIKSVYLENDLSAILKYNAAYVYYGREERNSYPQAESNFENLPLLRKVFDNGEVKIFKLL